MFQGTFQVLYRFSFYFETAAQGIKLFGDISGHFPKFSVLGLRTLRPLTAFKNAVRGRRVRNTGSRFGIQYLSGQFRSAEVSP